MDLNLTAVLKPTYQLDDEAILALFWNSLCSGSIGYGEVQLDCTSKEAYEEAQEAVKILKAGSPKEYVEGDYYICSEDVWTQVFKAGNLIVIEYGADDQTLSTPVTLEDVYGNLNDMQINEDWILDDFAKGNDDGNTHDAFLQCLLLGEIIYG